MKELIKRILRKRNLLLRRLSPEFLTAFDLSVDLRLLIPLRQAICLDIGANRGQTIDLLRGCAEESRQRLREATLARPG